MGFVFSDICNNIAFYKETAFIIVGGFSFFYLLFSGKQANRGTIFLCFSLFASCFIWAGMYYFVVYVNQGDSLYGSSLIPTWTNFFKVIFSYLIYDPFVVMAIAPISMVRLYRIIKYKDVNPTLDALIFSGLIYFLAYIYLGIFQYHYALPVYFVSIIPVLYYFLEYQKKIESRLCTYAFAFLFLTSSIPTGLYLFGYYKSTPNNFQNTVEFLSGYIKNKDEKVILFLDGVNSNGNEVFHSFIQSLESRGLNSKDFDIKRNIDDVGSKNNFSSQDSKYSAQLSSEPSTINSGDLLILTPFTMKYVGLDLDYVNRLSGEYSLEYRTDGMISIPHISLVTGVKLLLSKRITGQEASSKNLFHQNYYRLPINYYVFKRK
ncbi:hypothetical protein [Vibrio sp. M260118]|uniref:hypothetical protein n=1 Tax=Vibrio sp. M260118 TaxID=3020896 RepID=UPI002F3E249C